jgi:plasmid stability protein
MKTTLDLPDDLVRQLKLRAVRDGRKLKDAAADIFRAGLAAETSPIIDEPAIVVKDKKTALPIIQCRRAAPRGQELTPERVAEILIAQEAGWSRDSG